MSDRKLIIVGSGPVGLEAALRAVGDGFDVTVLEREDVGAAVRRWGHVFFFTPFRMNSSVRGRKLLDHNSAPAEDDILCGSEFCDRYLKPLSESAPLRGRVLQHHEVLAVSRRSYGKSDLIGQSARSTQPFRVLVRNASVEFTLFADVLLDCSGFTSRHRFIGAGGIPCPGEQTLLTEENYRIPGMAGGIEGRYAGRHTLVVGSGYSAATSVCLLADLTQQHPDTRVTWLTRGARDQPITPMPQDPLPERARLVRTANELATRDNGFLRWISNADIEGLEAVDHGLKVRLIRHDPTGQGRADHIVADEIIANPGYRPNTEPFRELQVHRCYATEGPIRLAAHLLGETSADCLQQVSPGPGLLKNPEPGFYILGAASYGRDSRFLLQTGQHQIDELFDHLAATKDAVA